MAYVILETIFVWYNTTELDFRKSLERLSVNEMSPYGLIRCNNEMREEQGTLLLTVVFAHELINEKNPRIYLQTWGVCVTFIIFIR